MKNLLRLVPFLVLWTFMPAMSYGQYEGTTVKSRLENKIIGNRQAYTVYSDFRAANYAKDWKAAYRPWRELMTDYPDCDFLITYYGTADGLLRELIKAESDSIWKIVYYEDIEEMLAYAKENVDAINSFDDVKHITVTLGDIQCWQAFLYWDLRKELGKYFVLEEAYNKFAKAFETVRTKDLKDNGELNLAYLIEEYFTVCVQLYELDKEKNLERFLTDYINCLESCDKLMAVYRNDSTQWRIFADRHNNVQARFYGTYGNNMQESMEKIVQDLTKYYTPLVEENKNDNMFLKKAIDLMMQNGCLNEDVFFKACEYSYRLSPNYGNCIGLGEQALVKDTNRIEAREYFIKALDLAKNAKERWVAARFTADALMPGSSPEKVVGEPASERNEKLRAWQTKFSGPIHYYNIALEAGREAGIPGQYLSEVYYNLSDCYCKQIKFNEAEKALVSAKEVYPLFSSNKYRIRQETIKNGRETEARNAEIRRKNKKAQAAYDAYIAKQKAEEGFWKGEYK